MLGFVVIIAVYYAKGRRLLVHIKEHTKTCTVLCDIKILK